MTEVKRRRRRAAPAGIAPNEPERDILDQYLYEVSTYPLLKGTEEIELARKIRAGDQDALQELVKRNLRFVISVAKKYQNRGLPLIDLIGEGNVGLLTAARKFDPDQGVKFISYAVWWIRQAILSALARQGRTVRVPLNRTADLSRIIKASRDPAPEAATASRAPKSCRSSPVCRSTSCSRSPRSTRATCASTRRWIRKAIARSSSASSPTRCPTPRRRR